MPQTIVVESGTEPQRVDKYLSARLSLSRTKIQDRLKAGEMTVNGKTHDAHDHVHPGDTIEIADEQVIIHEPVAPSVEPVIIAEDENYLVVNKPSGLVAHGGPGIDEPTLADWAVAHDAKISLVGDRPDERPGIVHRLDRDVSGVMVMAKTKQAFEDLKSQFQNHSIGKKYIALVYGFLAKDSGKIDFAISRKPDHSGLMVARPGSTEGRAAETHFRVLKSLKGMTLVEVETLTGRTHQIRVHFKAIGHSLVGDPLYRNRKLKIHKIAAPRLCLHASRLQFTDLAGERRRYEAPLPIDLQQFFARLGG